jgi:hypothetical protein
MWPARNLTPGRRTRAPRPLAARGWALAAVLVLCGPVGAAEEWRVFATSTSGSSAINLAGIERSEDLFFAEYRVTLATETESRFGQGSVAVLRKKAALSCGREIVAVVEVAEIGRDGEALGRASVPREQWKFFEPAPGSADWKFRQLVCRAYAEKATHADAPPATAGASAAAVPLAK